MLFIPKKSNMAVASDNDCGESQRLPINRASCRSIADERGETKQNSLEKAIDLTKVKLRVPLDSIDPFVWPSFDCSTPFRALLVSSECGGEDELIDWRLDC